MQQKEWLGKHLAFMKQDGAVYRPTKLRQRALVAIDAGGPDGVPMGDVHRALASAHLPAKVINMIADRLVADGHAYRERVETGGRPRVQMWSFRHAPEAVRDDMAYTGVWAPHSHARLRWYGKDREAIVIEVLGAIRGVSLGVKDIEIAAGQLYLDEDERMGGALYRGRNRGILTLGQMKAELRKMALHRIIRQNEFGDEFSIQ